MARFTNVIHQKVGKNTELRRYHTPDVFVVAVSNAARRTVGQKYDFSRVRIKLEVFQIANVKWLSLL